jgi:membrane protein implicated in regulation of membrane protease activity
MVNEQNGSSIEYAWRQQRIWSKTADSLKKRIDQGRVTALWLGIAAAGLAVTAAQVGTDADVGRWFAFASGLAAALVPFSQRRASTEHIRAWTSARSVSEGLKTEVFTYLALGSGYGGESAGVKLADEANLIVAGAGPLQQHTVGIDPDEKQIPEVQDVDSYIDKRVNGQIEWYRGKAVGYKRRASRLHGLGNALAALAAAFGVAAGIFGISALAAWIPFLTTVGTALVAFIAASRYDRMIIEYSRTEQQLRYLRDGRLGKNMGDDSFIEACESVVSVENQAWMSRWNDPHKGE